ncbi:hypothetical protein GCM10028811_00680 [Uliginosibacterium sediminicola]
MPLDFMATRAHKPISKPRPISGGNTRRNTLSRRAFLAGGTDAAGVAAAGAAAEVDCSVIGEKSDMVMLVVMIGSLLQVA